MCLVTFTGHQACALLLLNQFDIRAITRQITSLWPHNYPRCKGKACNSTTMLAPLYFKVPFCFGTFTVRAIWSNPKHEVYSGLSGHLPFFPQP